MNLLLIMIKCLLCTIVIEILIALVLNIKDKKDLLYVVLVNILTNPIVVLVPILINSKFKIITLYSLEILTVFIEGYIYLKVLKYKKLNPFILSILLNLSSYLIGGIINMI